MDDLIRQQNDKLRDHMLQLTDPEGWRETIDETERSLDAIKGSPWLPNIRTVFIVGHGTSYATAQLVESWISKISRIHAVALPAFRFAEYTEEHLIDPESALVIAISCSGNTSSVVKALERANESGAATLIISGRNESNGALAAHERIATCADIEKPAGVSAYTVSHLFMALAGFRFAVLLGEENGALDESSADLWRSKLSKTIASLACLPRLFEEMGAVAASLEEHELKSICVLGSGPNTGTMTEGALKISEFSWMFGAGEELEDFAHGRFREVDSHVGLFVVAPGGPSVSKTMDLLAGSFVSKTPVIVLTDTPSEPMHKLAKHIVGMPKLDEEYLTPFLYVFPLWFYGWHVRNNAGHLVGEKRHGLLAVDINYSRHFAAQANKKQSN